MPDRTNEPELERERAAALDSASREQWMARGMGGDQSSGECSSMLGGKTLGGKTLGGKAVSLKAEGVPSVTARCGESDAKSALSRNIEDVVGVASFQLQSRDLQSKRLLGKGLSGIGYETTWKGERFARKDFLGAPRDIFEKEAGTLVGLEDHENIVKTYGYTVDKRSCSLVLEYMDDDLLSLSQKRSEIQQGFAGVGTSGQSSCTSTSTQPFDLSQALDLMLQIATGMEALHEQGIAHGDLKTKNILVNYVNHRDQNFRYFSVKVSDFGLVWTKRKSKPIVSREVRKLDIIQWKAPEYLKVLFRKLSLSKDNDETSSESESESESEAASTPPVVDVALPRVDVFAADVYSFAVTCSQILTGEDPYPSLHWKDLGDKIMSGLRPHLPDACPPLLRNLLNSCWGDPAQRPTFSKIREGLEHHEAILTTDFSVDVEGMTRTVPSLKSTISQDAGREQHKQDFSTENPGNVGQNITLSDFLYGRDHEVKKFRGVRHRANRKRNTYVAEIRSKGSREKLWLGSYKTPEEAARAFDIGNLYFKQNLPLNFPDSAGMLWELPSGLSPEDVRGAIKDMARAVARDRPVTIVSSDG